MWNFIYFGFWFLGLKNSLVLPFFTSDLRECNIQKIAPLKAFVSPTTHARSASAAVKCRHLTALGCRPASRFPPLPTATDTVGVGLRLGGFPVRRFFPLNNQDAGANFEKKKVKQRVLLKTGAPENRLKTGAEPLKRKTSFEPVRFCGLRK